jgi:cytoskeletal protein CcmA (bactofilin family)
MGNRAIEWKRRVVADEPPVAETADPPPATERKRPKVTRIEPGCEIDGVLSLEGPMVIEGEFRGEIRCRDQVTVLQSGTVEASIQARSLTIEGAVVGDVSATREVVIARSGRLHGDVETPCLVVERGAFFQGATRMYRPEQLARRQAEDAPEQAPAPAEPKVPVAPPSH